MRGERRPSRKGAGQSKSRRAVGHFRPEPWPQASPVLRPSSRRRRHRGHPPRRQRPWGCFAPRTRPGRCRRQRAQRVRGWPERVCCDRAHWPASEDRHPRSPRGGLGARALAALKRLPFHSLPSGRYGSLYASAGSHHSPMFVGPHRPRKTTRWARVLPRVSELFRPARPPGAPAQGKSLDRHAARNPKIREAARFPPPGHPLNASGTQGTFASEKLGPLSARGHC
mmetsp:Transcript_59005/g.133634  ORF Transcript_59005/g.133634 Transcript_59005/m.133634 type:complete len:226 (-) Transcript_59005:257-934(-)